MSTASTDLVNAGLAKIDDDLKFVMECLREVLDELGEPRLAALVPWTGQTPAPHEGELPARLGQVYATAFQLLNLIEETVSAQVRRARERASGSAAEPGLWGANLQRLAASGLGPGQIAEGLGRVMVEPVLTAHPTEAKRAAALEQHRRLFGLLQEREDPRRTPLEMADLREEIKVTLERLWRTGEILLQKPEVAAERRNLMYYFREVFPRALPELDRRLRQAWTEAGFDPEPLAGRRALPRLRFGTWVGGARDLSRMAGGVARGRLARDRAAAQPSGRATLPVESRAKRAGRFRQPVESPSGRGGRTRKGDPPRRPRRTLEAVRPAVGREAAPRERPPRSSRHVRPRQ